MKLHQSKVLLIEDDLTSCYFVKYFLESKGVCVEAAGTGGKGLEKLLSSPNRYNLIITDIGLPDINGIELIKKIRQESRAAIVALSSLMDNALHEKCLTAGAQKAFNKPLTDIDFAEIGLLILKSKLPEKQLQVLSLYNKGYNRKASAQALGVTENTVAWYLKKIKRKFNISSRREMMSLEKMLQEGPLR